MYSPGPIGSSTSFCSPGNYLPILRRSPFATRGLGNSFDEVRCSLAWVTSHYLGSSQFALHWRVFRSLLFAVPWRRLAEARPHCDHLHCLPLDFFLGLTDSKSKELSIFVLDVLGFSGLFSDFCICSLIFCDVLVFC